MLLKPVVSYCHMSKHLPLKRPKRKKKEVISLWMCRFLWPWFQLPLSSVQRVWGLCSFSAVFPTRLAPTCTLTRMKLEWGCSAEEPISQSRTLPNHVIHVIGKEKCEFTCKYTHTNTCVVNWLQVGTAEVKVITAKLQRRHYQRIMKQKKKTNPTESNTHAATIISSYLTFCVSCWLS